MLKALNGHAWWKMLYTCGHNQHTLSSACLALNDFFLSGPCRQSNTLVPIMLKGTPSNGILSPLKKTFLCLAKGSGSKEIKGFVMFVMISTVIWSETCALGNPMYYIQPLQISLPFSSVLHIHLWLTDKLSLFSISLWKCTFYSNIPTLYPLHTVISLS